MKRFLSLDVMRGITIACMIMVNNGYGETFAPLEHSKWNGLTPCDLVFPFFLFMVGVSIYISLSRHAGEPGMVRRIMRRTVVMFAIGVLLHVWEMLLGGKAALIADQVRVWGVLQRIALSYCAAALIFHYGKGRWLWHTVIGLLVIYAVILLVGHGYSEDASANVLARVDRSLFGNHLYRKMLDGRSPVDPEGLVGTLSSTALTLLGVICGRAIIRSGELTERLSRLLLIAAAIGITGWFMSFGLPFNKRIFSPSYVLFTSGMAAALLGLLTWIVDVRQHQRWCRPFCWFGMNALGIYVLGEMLPPVLKATSTNDAIYSLWSAVLGTNPWSSLCYALTLVAMLGLVAWILYKNKIYIKI